MVVVVVVVVEYALVVVVVVVVAAFVVVVTRSVVVVEVVASDGSAPASVCGKGENGCEEGVGAPVVAVVVLARVGGERVLGAPGITGTELSGALIFGNGEWIPGGGHVTIATSTRAATSKPATIQVAALPGSRQLASAWRAFTTNAFLDKHL